jgi:hypothetical protein
VGTGLGEPEGIEAWLMWKCGGVENTFCVIRGGRRVEEDRLFDRKKGGRRRQCPNLKRTC